jgi:hypothetical protein
MSLYSFKKNNPDWEVFLYSTQGNNENPIYKAGESTDTTATKNYFQQIEKLGIQIINWDVDDVGLGGALKKLGPAQKSDLLAWHVLSTVGGFYSDMDIIYIKPMEEFYKQLGKTDTLVHYYDNHFSIGFLGSSPGNRFYKDLLSAAKVRLVQNEYQSAGVSAINALCGFSRCQAILPSNEPILNILCNKYPSLNIQNLEKFNIICLTLYAHESFNSNIELPEHYIGLHWYGGDTNSVNFKNMLDKDNFENYDNTLTKLLRRVLQ